MDKELLKKKIGITLVLLIVALVSMFGISKVASSPETHASTIKFLDEKKITVMELSAATAGTATALAAIPSDATTPLANQILELSTYLLIVTGAIFLEKILLTLTGYVTFSYLIPLSCVLLGVYLYVKNETLKNLAIKICIFGLAIFMVVPVSVKVNGLIEDTYKTSIDATIEEAKDIESATEKESTTNENEGLWDKITSGAKDFVTSIGDGIKGIIEKGERVLSNFIDAIAILIITSCVIPIAVLVIFIWIIKMIFNINIPVPTNKRIKINAFKPKNKVEGN